MNLSPASVPTTPATVASCFHGGSFFSAIGPRFEDLQRKENIINADVLDAWFPPAPGVVESLEKDLSWLLRTSPPTACEGLIDTIAQARGIKPQNLLPGAGSSDLIFRAFGHWLHRDSRVLVLDPTYGEYLHVLEKIIGCRVSRLPLDPSENYDVNLHRLEKELASEYDLVVLVNPNSPTGRHIPKKKLEDILKKAPEATKIWLDETYIDYLSLGESLEQFAASSENVIVCKSMSKVYALSGARVAYLCGAPHQLESLRSITPPWVIGLPSQLAAVRALEDPSYYQFQINKTHYLRDELSKNLRKLGWDSIPGFANFLLCRLPSKGPSARKIIARCQTNHLFLRDPGNMGSQTDHQLLRIAVKDHDTNAKMIKILQTVLSDF